LRFERNGRITGYDQPNEVAWRIEDGRLLLLRWDGAPSCVLTPSRNPDGNISLSGRFLFSPRHVIHNLDEIVSDSTLPEINTYDLFDTLIARRCHDPDSIFLEVEKKSGVPNFAQLRRAAEGTLWEKREYGLDDIYEALGNATGWPAEKLTILRILELTVEWDNLFPIGEMIARVGPRDMILSDMYLPIDFLRRVVEEKCGLTGRAIYVSNYGKRHGTVWRKILASHRIARHHGDNNNVDVQSARRAGIEAEHVIVSGWTRGESILADIGLVSFAKVIRVARLLSFNREPRLRRAQLAQCALNLPLLTVASLAVLKMTRELGVDTLLMCSRDCNLWFELMRWMAVRSSAKPNVCYLLSSRKLFRAADSKYVAYFLRMRGERSMLIDVSGTGKTPAEFVAKIGAQEDTFVFLATATTGGHERLRALTAACGDVRIEVFSEQPHSMRHLIEALNSSLDGQATGVNFDGQTLDVSCDPNEFLPISRQIINAMRGVFLNYIEHLQLSGVSAIRDDISLETLRRAGEAVIESAKDFRDDLSPVLGDVVRTT
jgi:hypothetical protein